MAKKSKGNQQVAIGLAICGVLVVFAVVASRFLSQPPPPPPEPPPPPPTTASTNITERMRYTDNYYKSVLAEDAKRFGIEVPPVVTLAQPLPYTNELDEPKRLKADKGRIETDHLRLSTKVVKAWASTAEGAGFRYEHVVLEITNKSAKFIAYHVSTGVDHPERCTSKGAMPQNAIALRPGETVTRTECLWRPGGIVDVKSVEVIEIPELSYYYVSRLVPSQIAIDERVSAGHEVPKGKMCQFIPWREIQRSGANWADLIDFYARHNCDEYSFWSGSKRWTQAGELPAKPPS